MKNRIQLLAKIAFATGIALFMAGDVKADTISFLEADAAGATLSNGTLSGFTPLTVDTVITSQSYTVTDVDLDGDGVFDDFTLNFDITGANSAGPADIRFDANTTLAANEYDVAGGTFNLAGESITFGDITLVPATASLGSPIVLNSAVWDSVSYRRWPASNDSGDESSIVGSSTNITNNVLREVPLSDTSFTTAWVAGTWNIDDVGFTVDVTAASAAVPEPSSMALIGLGSLLLVSRRRRV